MCPVEGEAYH